MPHFDDDFSRVSRTSINQQKDPQQESTEKKTPKGTSEGRSVSETKELDRATQDELNYTEIVRNRVVTKKEEATFEKTDDFIDKIADISMRNTDIKFIKQASASTLLSFSLAAIACLGVAIALTLLWPLVVPLAVAVVLSGILITYLASSNTKNKQEALLIITDFAVNLIQEFPDDNYQHVLDRLEQLATSKEFSQQVKLFKQQLKNVNEHESSSDSDLELTTQTRTMLTFMFNFIEQDLPEDQKIDFIKVKKQYLTKLLNNKEISKKLLDNILLKNSTARQQNEQLEGALAENKTALSSGSPRTNHIYDQFYWGIEIYLHQDQTNTEDINTNASDTTRGESKAVILEEDTAVAFTTDTEPEENTAVALKKLNTIDIELEEDNLKSVPRPKPQEITNPRANITPNNRPIKDNQDILKELGIMLEKDTSDNLTKTSYPTDNDEDDKFEDALSYLEEDLPKTDDTTYNNEDDEFEDALSYLEEDLPKTDDTTYNNEDDEFEDALSYLGDSLPKTDNTTYNNEDDEFEDALSYLGDSLPKTDNTTSSLDLNNDTVKLRRKQRQKDFVAKWSFVLSPPHNKQDRENIISANKFLRNRDYYKIISMIKKKHISPSYKFKRDENLLFFFANSDSYDNNKKTTIKTAIDTLIAKKFGVNSQNSDGDTPLMVAIKTSNPYVASILLDKQVDITIKNHNGEDALSLAKTYHDTQTQKKLEQLIKDRI